jgi:hypothetical protein
LEKGKGLEGRKEGGIRVLEVFTTVLGVINFGVGVD